ncbi:MAG: cytochrome P450, partial [Myxococcales bacterium]|nr:cytochrome P450 [Myxococcales bacterium]
DMRGYGGTDAPRKVRDYDLDVLVRDIVELIDALGADKVHLVGHDWGAAVAWEVAQFHGDRLHSLAILNCPPVLRLLEELRRPEQLRRQSSMQTVAREFGFDGLFTSEGQPWRRQRKLLNAAFAPQHIRTLAPVLLEITERLRVLWTEAARRGEAVDVHDDLRRYAGDVTTTVAFGEDVDSLRRGPDEFRRYIEDIFPSFMRRAMALIPYWRVFRLPRDRALDRDLAILRTKVGERIERTRRLLAAEPERAAAPANLLEAMIAARDDEDPAARLSDDEIFANALTILLAGEDTTSNTAAWMLDHLARAPGVFARLRAEVDEHFGEALIAPDLDCFDRMPYLRGTVQEALRLRSAGPLMFLQPNEDMRLGELELPPARVGTWIGPPLRWMPSADRASLRVELRGPGESVELRDIALFARMSGYASVLGDG